MTPLLSFKYKRMIKRGHIYLAIVLAVIVLLLGFGGGIWYSGTHAVPVTVPAVTSSTASLSPPLSLGVSQSTTSLMESTSSSTISFGIANCPSVVTTTAANGAGVASNKYALYDNTSTGISFCYPSYLTIRNDTSTRVPIPLITWPSGETMEFNPSREEAAVVADSLVDRILISRCAAGGPMGDLECMHLQDYQIIHGRNQSGLNYAIFWSPLVNMDTNPMLVVNSSTGPFAYVDTPGDSVVFVPGNTLSPTPLFVLQDLTVMLNTLSIAKPL